MTQTSIYLVNHTTKEFALLGNGENKNMTWVFKDYYWRENDQIFVTTHERDIPAQFVNVLSQFDTACPNPKNYRESDTRFPSFF